jgi:tetratricopeptide (TPR) repeat protein
MKGDRKMAREYIAQSLSLKNNYLEAVFLLSQIEVADGNLKAAIDSMQAATFIAPNDDLSFFRLGYLQYLNKDYKSAASALERAIALNPFFDNAKYFLGLSYDLLGRSKEALKIFENLNELYPDNREVILIIKNIKAGRKANEDLSQMSQDAGQVDQLPIKSKKDK